jgi:hypothetical protein
MIVKILKTYTKDAVELHTPCHSKIEHVTRKAGTRLQIKEDDGQNTFYCKTHSKPYYDDVLRATTFNITTSKHHYCSWQL